MDHDYPIASAPALAGLVLFGTAMIDLKLFEADLVTISTILGLEIGLIFSAVILILLNIALNVLWVFQRKWKILLLSWASFAVFFICFVVAGRLGAAFLNAT